MRSGRTATVAEVVSDLADRRHDAAHVADPAPAAERLGWRATTLLRTGLGRTVLWHAPHRPRSDEALGPAVLAARASHIG